MAEETVGKVELANSKLDDFNTFVRESEKSLEIKLLDTAIPQKLSQKNRKIGHSI